MNIKRQHERQKLYNFKENKMINYNYCTLNELIIMYEAESSACKSNQIQNLKEMLTKMKMYQQFFLCLSRILK